MRRSPLPFVLAFVLASPALAEGPFRPVATPGEASRLPATAVRARAASPFFFDARLFAEALRDVAAERADVVGTPSTLLELPHPDGGLALFRVIESPVMAPELAAKFPEIRTFRGEGIDDPTASVRFDVSPKGFSAMVLSAFGAWYVDPWAPGSAGVVAAYHRRDALRDPGNVFRCEGPAGETDPGETALLAVRSETGPVEMPRLAVGATLRTYRLALATTVEYSVAVCGAGPTKACVAAELATAMNRVTGIYERELAIRMTLVASNDGVIYVSNPDPYSNNNPGSLLTQNQSNLDSVIGSANYDIGHVFSTGGGGLAGLGVVCRAGQKARGETGLPNPVGDAFYVDFVAHEMGHQFGGNHTFNGSDGNCTGTNRNASTAYEPGSGSTIMAYAGICGTHDLQTNSDPYFHGKSFDEIVTYTTSGSGSGCAAGTATSNSAPAVEAGAAFTVPSRTPFALTGSATDAEDDPLTYGWEEFDLGAADAGTPLADDGSRPIFRSFNPTSSPTRVFPKLPDVLAGTPCPGLAPGLMCGETLPTTSRTMTFRLTARDGRAGGGGVNSDSTTVTSVGAAGPFSVSAPSTAVSWTGGSTQTVSWIVALTTAAPISCANVAIAFSSDGGLTFPTTLLASTPNDGSQEVTIPNVATTTARVRVACVGNVFFAISRPSFTVTAAPGPTVTAISPTSGTTAGDTSVTITGTGFVSGATVTLGGVPATSVVVGSSTTITAVTGARVAGTVDVVVTNPGPASGTLASGYTYRAGSAAGLRYHPVTPCRVVDTRNLPDGPLAGPILAASPGERTFTIVPGCGVPAEAKVVSANVTVTGGSAAGDLRVYPADAALQVPTTISFGAGKTRANNAMLLVSAAAGSGRVTVRNDSAAPLHLIVDVNGYFR
jgi:hypothetical protein